MSGRDVFIAVYVGVLLATWLLLMLVRRLAILRALRQHAPPPAEVSGWSMYRDARRYRGLCENGSAPIAWWYAFWTLHWLFVAMALGSLAAPSWVRLAGAP